MKLRFPLVMCLLLAITSQLPVSALHAATSEWPVVTGTVSESAAAGTPVLSLADLWSQSNLDWKIEATGAETKTTTTADSSIPRTTVRDHGFSIDATSRALIVSRPEALDFESTPRVSLTLTATERGIDSSREMFRAELISTGVADRDVDLHFGSTRRWHLEIDIADAHEPPALVEQSYQLDTSSLAPEVRLRASDPDGTTSHIWQLLPTNSSQVDAFGEFQINRLTGLLHFCPAANPNRINNDSPHPHTTHCELLVEVMDTTGLSCVGTVQIEFVHGVPQPEPTPQPSIAPPQELVAQAETTTPQFVDPSPDIAAESLPVVEEPLPPPVAPAPEPTVVSTVSTAPSVAAVSTVPQSQPRTPAPTVNTRTAPRRDAINAAATTDEATLDETPADESNAESTAGDAADLSQWILGGLLILVAFTGMLLWHRHNTEVEESRLSAERELRKAQAMRRIDRAHGRSELDLLLDQIQQVHERR